VRALFLAAVTPDNTPHGYNWTFAFPMLLFIVITLVLWALFGRPHRRIPARRLAPGLSSQRPAAPGAKLAATAEAPQAAGAEDQAAGEPSAGGSADGAAGASE